MSGVLIALDLADVAFSKDKDAAKFITEIQRISTEQDINDSNLHPGELERVLSLMLLNYLDASHLIGFSTLRYQNGKLNINPEEAIWLGQIQSRYNLFPGIGRTDDILDPANVNRIYQKAIDTKNNSFLLISNKR